MTGRIFLKILLTISALLAVAAFGADYLVGRITAENLRHDLQRALSEKTQLARTQLEPLDIERYAESVVDIAHDANARVTVIRSDGTVVADSEVDVETMENHATRPELSAALAGGEGVSVRSSSTVGVEFLYVAIPMQGGAVRLALPLSEIDARVRETRSQIFRMTLLALLPAVLLAAWLARRFSSQFSQIIAFSQRLAEGDFQARSPDGGKGELGELARSLTTTGGRLRATFDELQEERSRFAAAVNGIGEAILVADRKQRTVLFNPATERMFPDEPLQLGASLGDWKRREIPELFSQVLETGKPASADITIDGPVERTWKVSCAPIISRKGKVQAVVAVFYEITELDRIDRMRKDFVINVSHELRTPLAAIQGYAETLLDGAIDDPEVNRRFVRILSQNAERLAQLTADLMTLSQVEVNTREFAFSPHSVGELLRQAVDVVRTVAAKKSIEVSIESADERLVVECDSGAIHQVLGNLLDNAVKYSSEGGNVTLGAREKNGMVRFYVRDTGFGIPAEHIPRLFERFYRVDKARSRELGGTGLGLAIVKHLVASHHGSVGVESEPAKGSTFWFELPVKLPADAAATVGAQTSLF